MPAGECLGEHQVNRENAVRANLFDTREVLPVAGTAFFPFACLGGLRVNSQERKIDVPPVNREPLPDQEGLRPRFLRLCNGGFPDWDNENLGMVSLPACAAPAASSTIDRNLLAPTSFEPVRPLHIASKLRNHRLEFFED